jgi:IS5 family transposase
MSQMSFSDFEYASKRKQTRLERSLAEMDQVVPWAALLGLIELFYPKAGGGRNPILWKPCCAFIIDGGSGINLGAFTTLQKMVVLRC